MRWIKPAALAATACLCGGVLSGCGVLPGAQPTTVTVTAPSNDEPEPTPDSPEPSPPTSSTPAQAEWEDVFATAGPAVVRIDVTQCEGSGGSGSGFVVAPDLVMTAAHVVAGARTISVRGESGALDSAEVIGIAAENDVALARLSSRSSATPLAFAPELPERARVWRSSAIRCLRRRCRSARGS